MSDDAFINGEAGRAEQDLQSRRKRRYETVHRESGIRGRRSGDGRICNGGQHDRECERFPGSDWQRYGKQDHGCMKDG